MKTFKFRKQPFTQFVFKTAAFTVLLIACFTLSNCKKEADFDETLSIKNNSTSIETLAEQYPDNLFLDKAYGVEGRYIVMLKDTYLRPAVLDEVPSEVRPTGLEDRSVSRSQEVEAGVSSFLDEKGINLTNVSATYGQLFAGFAATLTDGQLTDLLSDPRVATIEQDILVTMEDEVVQVGKGNEGAEKSQQETPPGINVHGGLGDATGMNQRIWILDSGIQSTHPDLNVVAVAPYAVTFVGGTFEDCNGRGTHVAGIAAAINNTFGVVGMAAGAPVIPVKIMSGCAAPTYMLATLLSGLNHVALYDISGDVVNLSLGGYAGSSVALTTAVQALGTNGTWVVIAAGDNAAYAGNYQNARINGTKVLTIANMTSAGAWNATSNFNNFNPLSIYGSGPVDWIGVGTAVYSTWIGSTYATSSGSGKSAAHVTGIVYMRQAYPLTGGVVVSAAGGGPVTYKIASRI